MIGAMGSMAALTWLRMRGDRTALVFTLALPVLIVAVLGSIYMSEGSDTATLGLHVEAPGPVADAVTARLEETDSLLLRTFDDRAALDDAVRRRTVDAAVVVPAPAGSGPAERVAVELVGPPGVAAPGGVRAAVEHAVASAEVTVRLSRTLAPDDPEGRGTELARSRLDDPTDARPTPPDDDAREDAMEAVLATMVLFVFTNTMASAASWAGHRELGVLARLRTTSTPRWVVVTGYGLGLLSYALVQCVIVLAAGAALFGLPDLEPASVLVTVLATSAAAGGAALLTASVLPSSASGATVAGPVGFVLGMLGGALWPLDIVGPTLRTIGHVTPQAWAIDALNAAALGDPGPTGLPSMLALLLLTGLVLGAAGLRRMTAQGV